MVESNYMTIVEFIMQDYGEEVHADLDQFNTGASESIRPFMTDILEFIADLHVLSKLKVRLLILYVSTERSDANFYRNRQTVTEWVGI